MLYLVLLYNSILSQAELQIYRILLYWSFFIPLPLTCNCCFFTWLVLHDFLDMVEISTTISYSILNVNWIVIIFLFHSPQYWILQTPLWWLIYFLLPLYLLYVTLESSHKLEPHKVQNMAKNRNTGIAIGLPCLLLLTFKQKIINL